MDLYDVDAIERVESELDAFVEKRAREAKAQRETEELYDESVRREKTRVGWIEFHTSMAESHQRLADDHAHCVANLTERRVVESVCGVLTL